MIDWIICAATNLFRIYLVRKFIYVFLGNTVKEKRKEILAYGAFFLINTGLFMVFHLMWVNVFNNLLGIGLLVLLYTKSIKTNLFVTSSICLICMGCDTLTTLLFVDYREGQGFNQFYVVVTVFLIFICELLTEKIIGDHRKNPDTVQNLPLIAVPLCSVAIILFLTGKKPYPDMELVTTSIGLLIINFLVFYLYNMLLKSLMQKYENELLRHKIQISSNQINIILQNVDAVKTLKHDMKHHLNELKLLAKKNDTTAIQEYIDSMEAFIHNPNEIVSSGNMEIDSVLNYMLQKARQELRSVKVKVRIPEAIGHSFDINIILGNLLENAIEAAAQTEEKLLDVSVQLRKGVLRIEMANSFNGTVRVQNSEKKGKVYLSTKKEPKGQHGIGLGSVRKIVEKYNGIMETFDKDNIFYVKLMLCMVIIKN